MGIQAFILASDLRAVGCTVEFFEDTSPVYDEDGEVLGEHTLRSAEVQLPDGTRLGFHASDVETLWVDANHWGDNRRTHLQPLADLGVTWKEY